MLRSSLCDYRESYILLIGTIAVPALAPGRGSNNIQVVFQNCALFSSSISEINNKQIGMLKTSM